MIRAILANKKVVTRRPVKPSNTVNFQVKKDTLDFDRKFANGDLGVKVVGEDNCLWRGNCKYQVGDTLYVKETFHKIDDDVMEQYAYKADYSDDFVWKNTRWTPSIFMPEKASRIYLNVTKVHSEKLRNINRRDIGWEGLRPLREPGVRSRDGQVVWKNYQGNEHFAHNFGKGIFESFKSLWDSIYAEKGYPYESNPLVWVIQFEMTKQTEGRYANS
jgi:hypothetical protein